MAAPVQAGGRTPRLQTAPVALTPRLLIDRLPAHRGRPLHAPSRRLYLAAPGRPMANHLEEVGNAYAPVCNDRLARGVIIPGGGVHGRQPGPRGAATAMPSLHEDRRRTPGEGRALGRKISPLFGGRSAASLLRCRRRCWRGGRWLSRRVGQTGSAAGWDWRQPVLLGLLSLRVGAGRWLEGTPLR